MPRSQTANRRRSTIKKVSRKPKLTVDKCQRFQHSALEYDDKKSQFTNYSQLGLLADANQIGAVKDKITGFKPRVKVQAHKGDSRTGSSSNSSSARDGRADGVHPLELEVGEALKTVRRLPEGERTVLLKLVAKHGDDYTAMARDHRVNTLQHTAAHLRRRIQTMHEEDEQDADALAVAASAGAPAPPPYLRKKQTKDVNPAFKKRAMNFS